MNKLSLFCIIFLLTISSFAGAYWVSLDGSSERSPEVNVVYSNNAETVLEFRIFGFNVEETFHNGKTYHRISIPDVGGKAEETGKPELPLLARPVGIPDNAEVSFTVLDFESKDTTGFLVFPAQKPTSISDTTDSFYIDTTFYNQDIFYPTSLVELPEPAIMRTIHLVDCICLPIEYNPFLQTIRIYTYLKVKLNFTGGIPIAKHITTGQGEFLKNFLMNYDFLNIHTDLPDRRDAGTEYLFIVYHTHSDKIDTLVNWYKMLGFITKVKIYSYTPSYIEIKNYISNEYFSHSPPCLQYVALVGSRSELPPFEYGGQYPTLSDSWFSFLNGNDLYADISIGRIPGNVANFIDRIMEFETDPYWVESGWLDRALLVAHYDPHFIYFLTTIKNTNYSNWSPDFTLLTGADHVNNDVRAHISATQLVCYDGHGEQYKWQEWSIKLFPSILSWTIDDIDLIDHSGRAPILFSLACLNNYLGGCINIYWTSTYRKKAVSAALGAANELWDGTETYGKWLFNGVGNNLYKIDLAGVHNAAVAKMLSIHQTEEAKANAKTLLLLGDPGMEVWTSTPVTFTVKNDMDGYHGGKMKIVPVQVDSPWKVKVQKWGRKRYFKVETVSPQDHNGKTYYFHHWDDGHENCHYIYPNPDQDETRIATLSLKRFPAWEYLSVHLPVGKKYHGATAADGKAYALFGEEPGQTWTNTSYAYDPFTEEWLPIDQRYPIRKNVAAVTLNGKIYVLGGNGSLDIIFHRMDMYDPETKVWSLKPSLPNPPKTNHAACVYLNKIYTMGGYSYFGGDGGPTPSPELYIYDASINQWRWWGLPWMGVPRYDLVSAEAIGKIYAIGGYSPDDPHSKTCVEAFNRSTESWEQDKNHGGNLEPMPFPLVKSSCVSVNEKIYVIGGEATETIVSGVPQPWTSSRAIVLEYDAPRNKWTWKTSIQSERSGLALAVLPTFQEPPGYEGQPAVMGYTIYVIGGAAKIPITHSVEVANLPIEVSHWSFGFHNGRILDTDSSNRIHFVFRGSNGWIYYTSSKNGICYENPMEIGQGTNQNLAIDQEDNVHLIWFKSDSLYYKKFDENTKLWSENVVLAFTTPQGQTTFGGPTIAVSQDSLFVVWESKKVDFQPPRKALLFGSAYIRDVGSTFHYSEIDEGTSEHAVCFCQQPPETLLDTILNSPSIDIDAIGNPYMVWEKVHPFKDIFFYERDNGEWTSIIISDTGGCTQEMEPNIKIQNGVINVVWAKESDPCEPIDIYYRKGYIKGEWEPVKKVCLTDKGSRYPVWSNGYILWEENGDIYRNKYDYSVFDFESDVGENLTDIGGIQPDIDFSAPRIVTVGKNVYEFFKKSDTSGTRICLNVEEMEKVPPLYAINFGSPDPTPFTIERDGYVAYGENFFESVDFDSTKLIYHFDGIEPAPHKNIELVLYHKSNKDRELRIKIDNHWTRNVWVSSGEPVVVEGMIPVSCLEDGEINVTIEPVPPTNNELAVCSAIWIYDLSTGQGGPQFAGKPDKTLPIIYSLRNSYPDPFSKNTIISYSIAKSGNVSLKIYDISGRLIKTLVNKEQDQGMYKIRWEGTNKYNRKVSSGVYFYRLKSGNFLSTKKIVCVR